MSILTGTILLISATLAGGALAFIPVRGERKAYQQLARLERRVEILNRRASFTVIQGGKTD